MNQLLDTNACSVFCPDRILDLESSTFADDIHELEDAVGFEFMCIKCVRKALVQHIGTFFDNGCRAAEHSMGYISYAEASVEELSAIFRKAMAGEALTRHEIDAYKTDLLQTCAREYARRGMDMQIRFSCPVADSSL